MVAPASPSPANPPTEPLRLGTRASPLAMAQAHQAAAALTAAHGWPRDAIRLCPVVASGDKVLDRPLADIGGKALWTKELDRALGEKEIDFAVHSMKDVETIRPDALTIAAMLPRADVRDRLVGLSSLTDLPQGGTLGTSSPRRAAQVRRARPDVQTMLFRGNVQTRLAKLDAGEVDATLLAAAGLDRLDKGDLGTPVPIDAMLPAPAQGAIGIECRTDDTRTRALLNAINHADTFDCVMAERAFLLALGGTCHSPVAALCVVEDGDLWLRAEILSGDGALCEAGEARFARGRNDQAGALARALLGRAAPPLRALFTA